MKPNPKILVQVVDVEGSLWDVRLVRDTRHGFDLLFGSPARLGVYRGGLPRLIAMRPLADFWEAHQTKQPVLFDLPAGRTTLKRVRSRLGFLTIVKTWPSFVAGTHRGPGLTEIRRVCAAAQGPRVHGVGYTKETARQLGPPGGLVAQA